MTDPTAYDFGIGVTYEVGVLTDNGFAKLPYTTSVFSHNKKSFGLRLIFSNNYVRDELFVALTLAKNQPNINEEGWVYLQREFLLGEKTAFYVSNPLNRIKDVIPVFNELHTEKMHVGARSAFSIAILEAHQNDSKSVDGSSFGLIANMPAAVVHGFAGNGAYVLTRALFLRDVEEFYLGRTFTPPANQEAFYRKQNEIRAKGISFDFDGISLDVGTGFRRLETKIP